MGSDKWKRDDNYWWFLVKKALNGQVISVIEKDGKIWLKDSNENYSEITSTDIMGSNGVIHVIDSVVMPK